MAKRTVEKTKRMHDKDGYPVDVIRPAAEPRYRPCLVCKEPMAVGVGQFAKYHKECRQFRKRATGRRQSIITPSFKIQN